METDRRIQGQGGFTLVELLVSLTVVAFCISLVLGVFVSQQQAFTRIDFTRIASESGRDALLDMESSLRRAGFGVDPRYGFDFTYYRCAAASCRDSVSGPDELVFVARNPNYQWTDNGATAPGGLACATPGGCFAGNGWNVSSIDATNKKVTITTHGSESGLIKGRTILIACPNGQGQTMGTIDTPPAAAGTTLTLSLLATPLSGPATGNPYYENNLALGCLNAGAAAQTSDAVFLVDRFRYFIAPYALQDVPASSNPVPFLMLDTGLDLNLNGTTPDQGDNADLIPIAKGVEDLQVAYVINNGTPFGFTAKDLNADWVSGNSPGSVEQPVNSADPTYDVSISDQKRYLMNAGNVHEVRFELSIRSLLPDPTLQPGQTADTLPLNENRNVGPGPDRFRRLLLSSTVTCRDMASRSAFIF